MIILVLISIAVMVLIPLISGGNSIPHWQKFNVDGNEFISVGANDDTRVGVGINPYTSGNEAKFATTSLAIDNGARNLTTPSNSILLTDNYNLNTSKYNSCNDDDDDNEVSLPPVYAKFAADNSRLENGISRSIVIGMNACMSQNADVDNSVIIRSSGELHSLGKDAKTNNDYVCQSNTININDRILVYDPTVEPLLVIGPIKLQRSTATYTVINDGSIFNTVSGTLYDNYGEPNMLNYAPRANSNLATDAFLTLKYINGLNSDIFRINEPVLKDTHSDVGAEVLAYNGNTLRVATTDGTMVVNGILTLSGISRADITADISYNEIAGNNIQCDLKDDVKGVLSRNTDTGAVSATLTKSDCTLTDCCKPKDDACDFVLSSPGGGEYTYCDIVPENSGSLNGANAQILGPLLFTSDKRLKNIIEPYVKGINDIAKLETYRFTYKNDKTQTTFVGIIAQKLVGLFDIALRKDSKGYYSYERTPILYAMTNSAKEIHQKQTTVAEKQKQMHKDADKLLKAYR